MILRQFFCAGAVVPMLAFMSPASAQVCGGPLQTASNLSDICNKTQAITNLGALPLAGGTITGSLGTISTGTSSSTGDGTTEMDFKQNSANFEMSRFRTSSVRPEVFIGYTNYSNGYTIAAGDEYPLSPALFVQATSEPGSNGSVAGIVLSVQSVSNNPFTSADNPLDIGVSKYGTSSIWGIDNGLANYNGLGNGSKLRAFTELNEFDINGNGPDNINEFWNPLDSNRTMLYLNGRPSVQYTWAARTTIGVTGAKHVIYAANATGVVDTFIPSATTGSALTCTTGAKQPIWPTSGTVTDGTCTWNYGTTQAFSIGSGISFISNVAQDAAQVHEWGTLIGGDAIIKNAAIDTSFMTCDATDKTCTMLRLGPNQGIDFSADQTKAGQNQHYIDWGTTLRQLAYVVRGVDAMTINDAHFATEFSGYTNLGGATQGQLNGLFGGFVSQGTTFGWNHNSTTRSDMIVMGNGVDIWTQTRGTISGSPAVSITPTAVVLGAAVQLSTLTVSKLPTCNTAAQGDLYAVTDALSPTWGSTLVQGGAIYSIALCNGTNWTAR